MGKLRKLTKYIDLLDGYNFGTWIIDRENDGTPEHPKQMPFVGCSEMVHHFIDDVYDFIDHNKDMELNRYGDILNQNGLEWGSKSMSAADVPNLDVQCVMALITGAVRAERFCDGALLGFFKDGSIRKWLERLKRIDGEDTQL
jgi:hypothetical protein